MCFAKSFAKVLQAQLISHVYLKSKLVAVMVPSTICNTRMHACSDWLSWAAPELEATEAADTCTAFFPINHANNQKVKYVKLCHNLHVLDGSWFCFIWVTSFDILTNCKFFSLFFQSSVLSL